MVNSIVKGADLSCGPLFEIKPSNFFEKIITFGSVYRRKVFELYNKGDNLFTCHGSHRAMSKKYYKAFRFAESVAEDAQSYLFCKKNGYKYVYTKRAIAFVNLPDNLKDHLSQSKRFFTSASRLSKFYNKNLIKQYSKWPIKLFVTQGLKMFFRSPIEAVAYTLVSVYTMIYSRIKQKSTSNTWQMVTSTKFIQRSSI
jgi:cellulose synthase/poly-beta-1,6-N-acetylglucosamine synthase-like glycosyltransferase